MIERAVLGGILVAAAGLASPGVVQAQEADGAARVPPVTCGPGVSL